MRIFSKQGIEVWTRIIASDGFAKKMIPAVEQQFESIINNGMTFGAVKIENNLSDFYSKKMDAFGLQLYKAMANKAYYLLLGEKLAQKSKELAATIINLRLQAADTSTKLF